MICSRPDCDGTIKNNSCDKCDKIYITAADPVEAMEDDRKWQEERKRHKGIYGLEMHEELEINENLIALKVHKGWIYKIKVKVFIPFPTGNPKDKVFTTEERWISEFVAYN